MTLHDRISKSLCKATLQSIRARVTRPKFILLFLVLNLVLIDITVSKNTKMSKMSWCAKQETQEKNWNVSTQAMRGFIQALSNSS